MMKDNNTQQPITGTSIFVSDKLNADTIKNEVDELSALRAVKTDTTNPAITPAKQVVLHKANTRGRADHEWLISNQSFSFADYYNAERMHFGVLRVLNDDWVAPGKGFGRHPHDNMEIISIPLEGALEHTDSMGNKAVIHKGDIQAMSAGTGIFHTEYNLNKDKPASFLQIWLFPKEKNVAPGYDQRTIDSNGMINTFRQILSPKKEDEGVWVNQDAWFQLGNFEAGRSATYQVKMPGNGVYVFVIKGEVHVEGQVLNSRDALGIWNTEHISLQTGQQGAEILLMDVPMSVA